MLTFDAPLFALAGGIAAAGPIIVHLLNRRRFRVVPWGAMDFLREALERQRRSLQFRDLLLLILRVLAISLFGCALARPYLQGSLGGGIVSAGALLLLAVVAAVSAAAFTVTRERNVRWISGSVGSLALLMGLALWTWSAANASESGLGGSSGRQPVHAVLVVDNSRSMGVASAAGTRLDRARELARRFLNDLPPQSRITLIPAAGSEQVFPGDAFVSLADAVQALDEIALVDAADDVAVALEAAEQACLQVAEPKTKRVVILSDLQSSRWTQVDWSAWGARLPGLQVAPVAEGGAANLWIASLELEDGFAGAEATSRFLAKVRAEELPRSTSVDATLRVDGVTIGSQVLELQSGQTRELEFSHRFDVGGEPGRPQWSTVTLELRPDDVAADRLAADNSLTILVPVLDAVPVVFVDQFGDLEDLARGRIGETYALRHLLSPRVANDDAPRRLIHVEHVRPEQVTTELLESARLVVVAGVESPEGLTEILREYVVQGGPLVLLAGGSFDPRAWQELAWLDGHGILPAPLDSRLLGTLPSAAADLSPFFVDFAGLDSADFQIEGEDPDTLAGIFESTPFFQAVRADVSTETLERTAAEELAYWKAELIFTQQHERNATAALPAREREHWRRLEPNWWIWKSPLPIYPAGLTADQIVERERPQVLARFTHEALPWAVQRRLGNGTVLFYTSGVSSDWNLLRSSGAMYVFHRGLFRLLSETLPRRNLRAGERIDLPLAAATGARWRLERPSGRAETLTLEALAAGVTGVSVRRAVVAGVYHLQAAPGAESPPVAAASAARQTPVASWAVQGPLSESELSEGTTQRVRASIGNAAVRLLSLGEPIHVEGGVRRGERLWTWGIVAVLLGLTAEMGLLSAPQWRRRQP